MTETCCDAARRSILGLMSRREALRGLTTAGISALNAVGFLPLCPQTAKPRDPFKLDEVIFLLRNDVPARRVTDLTRQFGISFELTPQSESTLREAGATDELMATLRVLSRPTLVVEVTLAGVRVLLDEKPVVVIREGNALKLRGVTEGTHRVRLSREGYRDYEETVELRPGRTLVLKAELERLSPPPEPPPASPPPQAVQRQTSPKLAGSSVGHIHGFGECKGRLILTSGAIEYRSEDAAHSFPSSPVVEVKPKDLGFYVRLKDGRKYSFVVYDQSGQIQPPDAVIEAIRQQAMGKN